MRKLVAALAATLFLALGACATNVNSIESVTTQVCKDGVSIADFLKDQQTKHPDYNIHIENVVTDKAVIAKMASVDVADSIVVFGAVMDGKPSGSVLLVLNKEGCATGQKFVNRQEAVDAGLLPTQAG